MTMEEKVQQQEIMLHELMEKQGIQTRACSIPQYHAGNGGKRQ